MQRWGARARDKLNKNVILSATANKTAGVYGIHSPLHFKGGLAGGSGREGEGAKEAGRLHVVLCESKATQWLSGWLAAGAGRGRRGMGLGMAGLHADGRPKDREPQSSPCCRSRAGPRHSSRKRTSPREPPPCRYGSRMPAVLCALRPRAPPGSTQSNRAQKDTKALSNSSCNTLHM